MYIAKINNFNFNQSPKKVSYNPNFGQVLLASESTRASFLHSIVQYMKCDSSGQISGNDTILNRISIVKKLGKLMEKDAEVLPKVFTNGASLVQVINQNGELAYNSRGILVDSLLTGYGSVSKTLEEKPEIDNQIVNGAGELMQKINEVAQWFSGILTKCRVASNPELEEIKAAIAKSEKIHTEKVNAQRRNTGANPITLTDKGSGSIKIQAA